MGGIVKGLFGSSGNTKVRQRPTILPEQRDLLQNILIPQIQGFDFSAPRPVTPFPGSSLAAIENTSLEGVGQTNTQRFTQPQDFDQFFTEGVVNPLMEQFNEEVIPGISRNYAPSGFYSSARLEADRQATEELGKNLIGERARMAFQDRDRQLQASQFLDTFALQEFQRQQQEAAKNELDLMQMFELLFQTIFGQAAENIVKVEQPTEGLIPGMLKAWAGSGGRGA